MKIFFYIFLSILFFAENSFSAGLKNALDISASGMQAQAERVKIITENIANTDTTGISPNDTPYRRKIIVFQNVKDAKTKANLVKVRKIDTDKSDFKLVYMPEHPAANEEGYVKFPNVDKNLESIDLKEAQRAYEANITAIENTKQMIDRSLDLLR
ncbi:MAG: flagellar basal body rod protein FlgC [Rickettsiales bacterium]|nr:flagellar basal body rod protein FlgC [Rickettsiales bacterium]